LKLLGDSTQSAKKKLVVQKTSPKDKIIIHAVRKGETLWTLSQKYGVTVDKIKQWNGLKQNSLSLNQKLKIFSIFRVQRKLNIV
jgi:LysM repeat protein